jgi:hypothetical protein
MKALNCWTNGAEEALEEVALGGEEEEEVPVGIAEEEAAMGVVAECDTEVAPDETPLLGC